MTRRFRTRDDRTTAPADSLALFRHLRRAPHVKNLWEQQGPLLRTYHEDFEDEADVALELPTGSGKTLVGLLIAEWHRRTHGRRVLYLCPTKQLVRQVVDKANNDYGIKALPVLRENNDYEGIHEYRRSRNVAVSVHAALFNSNPRFNDAEIIVLDDAHSSETFIANNWSVEITRSDHVALYQNILRLVKGNMPRAAFLADLLQNDAPSPDVLSDVEMIPSAKVNGVLADLMRLVDQHDLGKQRYGWERVRDHLHACNVYVSWRSILIRPVSPPSMTHEPFANAHQRIYMSATFGSSGDLERAIGVESIAKVPPPAGWEERSIGRRLFLVPDLALDEDGTTDVIRGGIKALDRGLVLTPSFWRAREVSREMEEGALDVLEASDVKSSLDPFTTRDDVALVLAARYDGIDLAGDECRFLLLDGLPSATTLQDQFLYKKLRLSILFRDRIRTRFTQGAGRCCRSDTDYAVVVLRGQQLLEHFLRGENQRGLHPELRAELEFGIENSEFGDDVQSVSDFADLIQSFVEDDDARDDIEADIEDRVRAFEPADDVIARVLAECAKLEVRYLYALWNHDFDTAIQRAQDVIDKLTFDKVKGYCAWWCYLGSSAAVAAHEATGDDTYVDKAKALLDRAARLVPAVRWFSWALAVEGNTTTVTGQDERSQLASDAAGRVFDLLNRLRLTGRKYGHYKSEMEDGIGGAAPTPFEVALQLLGEGLGFISHRTTDQGMPDGSWAIPDHFVIGFEAKSNESEDDSVSQSTAREAEGHYSTLDRMPAVTSDMEKYVAVVSPRQTVDDLAVDIGGRLSLLSLVEVRDLADETLQALDMIRARIEGMEPADALALIRDELLERGLDPVSIREMVRNKPLSAAPVA